MKVKFKQLFRWPLCVGESVPHRHMLPPLARALQWKGTAKRTCDALAYTFVALALLSSPQRHLLALRQTKGL